MVLHVGFFEDLESILNEYLTLLVCRLADPPKDSRGNVNLSVFHILELCPTHIHYAELSSKADKLLEFRTIIQNDRHKLISHLDKKTVLSESSLIRVPKEKWQEFFKNLQQFVDLLTGASCQLNSESDVGQLVFAVQYRRVSLIRRLLKRRLHKAS